MAFLIAHGDASFHVREPAIPTKMMSAVMTLNKVVGVCDLALFHYNGKEWLEAPKPTSIKKLLTGDGKADKDAVAQAARRYLTKPDMEFESDDVSDAIAAMIAQLIKTKQLKQIRYWKSKEGDT